MRLFFAKSIHEDAGQGDDEERMVMVKAKRKGLAAWQIGGEVPCFADEGWSCDRAQVVKGEQAVSSVALAKQSASPPYRSPCPAQARLASQ